MTALTHTSIDLLPYPIVVGEGAMQYVPEVLKQPHVLRRIIVVDSAVMRLSKPELREQIENLGTLLAIDVPELRKDLSTASVLWQYFKAHHVDRSTVIVIIGGGVLCDVAAFSAAVYMRGCPFILVPTTLLAQVDAAVGGKTGMNFEGIKNLVGTLSPPACVIIDSDFLQSLPERHIRSGYAEMLKHALIADGEYFTALVSNAGTASEEFPSLVRRSVEIKAAVVSRDPFEQGERKLLNFGHTIGHALEIAALEQNSDMSHGEAVAIGMVAEAWLSVQQGWLSESQLQTIEKGISTVGLATRSPLAQQQDLLLHKISHDKKKSEGVVGFTLLRDIGQGEIGCKVEEPAIREALRYITSL